MTVQDKIDLKLRLPFQGAGIEFVIQIGESDNETSFVLTVESLGPGGRVPFTSAASPVLADWVRGYTRWLYRARVSAQYTEDSISGTFAPGLTSEQTLEGLQLACDMIRQRFELYTESVLAG
jgi:hypothetical protein